MTTSLLHFADPRLARLFAGILGLLVLATIIGAVLSLRAQRSATSDAARNTIANLNARISAWWWMCAIFAFTLLIGRYGALALFGLLSLLALREYITLVPTHRADHRTLVWIFFIITPLQYYLIAIRWYGCFSIMIPALAFLLIPTRIALAGDTARFLERAAKIQFGIMICAYALSHAPALLLLDIPNYSASSPNHNASLLLFLVLIVQLADVLKYTFGKLFGRHKMVPLVSPNKTWEGFLGGVLSVTAVGAALWWATPFTPLVAAGMAFAIALLGAAGGMVMSAIKRDAGIKDFGVMLEGHGGILDRIDSLCFAAPIFFHLVRYYYVP